jgi:hypothetical protein
VWFETQASYFDRSFMLTRTFARFPDGVVQVCRKHNNRTWLFDFLHLASTQVNSKKMISPGHSRGSPAHAFITYRVIS